MMNRSFRNGLVIGLAVAALSLLCGGGRGVHSAPLLPGPAAPDGWVTGSHDLIAGGNRGAGIESRWDDGTHNRVISAMSLIIDDNAPSTGNLCDADEIDTWRADGPCGSGGVIQFGPGPSGRQVMTITGPADGTAKAALGNLYNTTQSRGHIERFNQQFDLRLGFHDVQPHGGPEMETTFAINQNHIYTLQFAGISRGRDEEGRGIAWMRWRASGDSAPSETASVYACGNNPPVSGATVLVGARLESTDGMTVTGYLRCADAAVDSYDTYTGTKGEITVGTTDGVLDSDEGFGVVLMSSGGTEGPATMRVVGLSDGLTGNNSASGTYTSTVKDAGVPASEWQAVRCAGMTHVLGGQDMLVQYRVGETATPDGTWSTWLHGGSCQNLNRTEQTITLQGAIGRYFQARIHFHSALGAVDNTGYTVLPTYTVSYRVDDGDPASTIANVDACSADGPSLLEGTASDMESGVDRVELQIARDADGYFWDGSGWVGSSQTLVANGASSWSYGSLTDAFHTTGSYTVRRRAVDEAGHMESDTWASAPSISFHVDATPPVAFDLSSPAAGALLDDGSVTLAWEATTDFGCGGMSRYEYCIDDTVDGACSAWADNGTGITVSLTRSEGEHEWLVRAVDGVGRQTVADGRTFLVDETPPPLPAGEAVAVSTSTIRWMSEQGEDTGTGGATSGFADYLWSPDLGSARVVTSTGHAANTPVTETLRWRDGAGNTSTSLSLSRWSWPLPPAVTGTRSVGVWFGPHSFSDDGAAGNRWRFENQITGGFQPGTFQRYEWAFGPSGSPPDGGWMDWSFDDAITVSADSGSGGYTMHVRSYNGDDVPHGGGGQATTLSVGPYRWDETSPDVFDLTWPPDGGRVGAALPPTFTWQATTDVHSGIAGYTLTVHSDPLVEWCDASVCDGIECSCRPAAALSSGVHTWTVTAVDVVGNPATARESLTLVVGPVLTVSTEAVDVNEGDLHVGDVIAYRVVVTNSGALTQTGLQVTDTVPVTGSLVPGSVSCSDAADCGTSLIGGAEMVTATLVSLASSSRLTVGFRVTVLAQAFSLADNPPRLTPVPSPICNTAWAQSVEQVEPVSDTACMAVVPYRVYLPLLLR